jgi:hypothetical protein
MRAPAAVGLQLVLTVVSLCGAAVPDPPRGVVGARKYATNLHDCNGAVAFSSAGAIAPTKEDNGKLGFRKALIDKGIGWSRESGEFTCFCPGLYQFAFAGSGKTAATRLTVIYDIIIITKAGFIVLGVPGQKNMETPISNNKFRSWQFSFPPILIFYNN